jgi:hypothetical protein
VVYASDVRQFRDKGWEKVQVEESVKGWQIRSPQHYIRPVLRTRPRPIISQYGGTGYKTMGECRQAAIPSLLWQRHNPFNRRLL